ncbi:hypothetical protein A2U01_0089370, partial [Trifolium medium]|nr:hypothetical protein [Trifolium medium]
MPTSPTSVNIVEVSRVTRSGRVFLAMSQKKNDASTSPPAPVEPPIVNPGLDRANETI